SLTTKNEDGKDTATLAFAKNGTDDKSGTGKITGLADITDKDGRDVATNKGYVDDLLAKSNNKVEDIDANRPFVFMLQENGKDVEVVKGRDGKLYKKSELANATYDDKAKRYKKADDSMVSELTEGDTQKVTIKVRSVDPDNKPMVIGNVASGLELTDKHYSDVPDGSSKKGSISPKEVKGVITNLLAKSYDDQILNNVATVRDLQALATSGLYFYGNDGEEIHKKLSQELRIKGDGVTQEGTKSFASAVGNINVKKYDNGNGSNEDAKQDLVIQLSKALKNMTSFETDSINHDRKSPITEQIKLDKNGLTVTHQETKDGEKVETKVGKDGTTIQELDKDGQEKPNGKSASYTLNKAELKDGDKTNTQTA
ncbi:hypothetical protein ACE4RU_11750, partial [Actinobacillus seminis]|uniref:hypothetical protein n=1 Tax=Actinobacillus seminis TaxID=722 RepID=UPI003B94EC8F